MTNAFRKTAFSAPAFPAAILMFAAAAGAATQTAAATVELSARVENSALGAGEIVLPTPLPLPGGSRTAFATLGDANSRDLLSARVTATPPSGEVEMELIAQNPSLRTGALAEARGAFEIRQDFLVQNSGSVQVAVEILAEFERLTSLLDPTLTTGFTSFIEVTTPTVTTFDVYSSAIDPDPALSDPNGSVFRDLSFNVPVVAGELLSFAWRLTGVAGGEFDPFVDFDGWLRLNGSWAVVSDDVVLIDPAAQAAVPVPAALPLLFAGLGGIACLRRRALAQA